MIHAQGMQAIVICSDHGAETIYLDRDGVPTRPMQSCLTCPDCLGAAALDIALPQGVQARHEAPVFRLALPSDPAVPARPRLRPETRGPPPATHGTHDMALAAARDAAEIRWSDGMCQPGGRPPRVALT